MPEWLGWAIYFLIGCGIFGYVFGTHSEQERSNLIENWNVATLYIGWGIIYPLAMIFTAAMKFGEHQQKAKLKAEQERQEIDRIAEEPWHEMDRMTGEQKCKRMISATE